MSLKSHSYSVSAAESDIVVVMNRRTATLVKDALEVVNPDRQCDEDAARNLALRIEVQISRGAARKPKSAPKAPLVVSAASSCQVEAGVPSGAVVSSQSEPVEGTAIGVLQ